MAQAQNSKVEAFQAPAPKPKQAGPHEQSNSWLGENQEILFSALAGILLIIGWVGGRFFQFPNSVSVAFYLAAYAFGGWEVARHALPGLLKRQFDTDLLMLIAALGAAFLGDFAEGAFLLFLFSLGHALEERALDRARAAVSALADLSPKTAMVRRDGQDKEVPVEELQVGETVIVRPGVRLPADGKILSGQSALDQAPITGESVPVDKAPGDSVFAGSINGQGALEVEVSKLARDNTLARVMRMVEEAEGQQSPTQQLTERFEHVFVPVVLMGTVLFIVIPPLLGVPFEISFLRAMTILVAASPCALALGTPATVLAGIAQAARRGVLIKGGAHLENLGRLQAIAFDKTGTITHGKPEITDVVPLNDAYDDKKLLALAATMESRSAHPLAQAVVNAAKAQGLTVQESGDVEAMNGRGLRGLVKGETVYLGNLKLLEEQQITLSDSHRQAIEKLTASGKTIMALAVGKQIAGVIGLADTLRSDAASSMKALAHAGVAHTIMLTGDHEQVAQAIAQQVGLTDVQAELMPEDKVTAVRDLAARYGVVAMVGDGVNDAPALANATVGIAMGGAGTDVALETADVALMGDSLSALAFAVGLGRATRRIIKQNLAISLGVIGFLVIASILGLASMGFAVVVHEGSTIVVVLNALRLLVYGKKA